GQSAVHSGSKRVVHLQLTIDCRDQPIREINRQLRAAVAAGQREVTLKHPDARHNLAVAIVDPVRITIEGSVGYYVGGMMDGPTIAVHGSAGWGAGESMMGGTLL